MLHLQLRNLNRNNPVLTFPCPLKLLIVSLLGILTFCCSYTTSSAQSTSKIISQYQNIEKGLPKPSPQTREMLQTLTILREPISEELLSIHFHALPQAQFAGFIVALEKGFYAEAGLPNLVLKWPDSPDNPDTFDLSYATPFCVQSLTNSLLAKQNGNDIINIAQLFQRSDYTIVAMASSGIKTPPDLNHKILQATMGEAQIHLGLFLKKFQITPKTIYPTGQNPTPLMTGAVDATMLQYYDGYHSLLQRSILPEELVTFRLYEYGLSIPGDAITTTIAYISDNPIICQAVVEATIKGWYYAFTHPDEALDIVMAYSKRHQVVTTRSHQAWMLNELYQIYTYKVGPDPRNWGKLSEETYNFAMDSLFNTNDYSRPEISLYYSPPDRAWAVNQVPSPPLAANRSNTPSNTGAAEAAIDLAKQTSRDGDPTMQGIKANEQTGVLP